MGPSAKLPQVVYGDFRRVLHPFFSHQALEPPMRSLRAQALAIIGAIARRGKCELPSATGLLQDLQLRIPATAVKEAW